MSSGCSGSLLGDMATRCALVQVRAVAGPRWGPASSAKMLESLNVLEYLCGCAPFFSHDMCAPFASSRADRATVGPAKQASKLLLTCLLACLDPLLEVGRNNFEIPRGNFASRRKPKAGSPKKKDCLPNHRRLAPPLVQPAVAHLPPWRCGDGLESLAAGGCALLVADAIEVSRALAADARQVRAPAAS